MNLQHFLKNRIIVDLPNTYQRNTCGVCGEATNCFDILKNTFTNLDQLKNQYICVRCVPLFSGKWLKTAFYFTNNKLQAIKQSDFEQILRNIEFPCVLSFSESRKKHRLFRSKVSVHHSCVYISVDDGEVCLNLNKDLPLFDYLLDFYRHNKVNKEWLLGELPTYAIESIGIKKYLEFQQKIQKYKGTQKYKILISFLNK